MPNSQTPETKATKYSAKEKDEETQYSYFGARYYNSDISVWLSVDPLAAKYPSLSPYAYCANNPLFFIDPNGMDLEVGQNEESKSDLLSIAKKDNQKRIIISETGNVTLDFSGLSSKEKKKLLRNDKGLNLINNMVESDKKFYFESSNVALLRDGGGGKATPIINVGFFNGVINASLFGKDANKIHTYLPREGYDGQVVVAIHGEWIDNSNVSNRKSLIFHELAENYYRTHYGYDYHPNKSNKGFGAHDRASWLEGSAFNNPAQGSFKMYNPLPIPTNILNKYSQRVSLYYGY
jgi:RHS repeat-associated protein